MPRSVDSAKFGQNGGATIQVSCVCSYDDFGPVRWDETVQCRHEWHHVAMLAVAHYWGITAQGGRFVAKIQIDS